MSGERSGTGNPARRFIVLYDGWPLAFAPGGPAALHLLEILEALPKGVEPWVALPFDAQDVQARLRNSGLEPFIHDQDGLEQGAFPSNEGAGTVTVLAPSQQCSITAWGHLRWEQVELPHLARLSGARWLHTTTTGAPLVAPTPLVVSPTGQAQLGGGGEGVRIARRVGDALGQGGLSRARALLLPNDLPLEQTRRGDIPAAQITPRVHSKFSTAQPLAGGLPEDYVLVTGPLNERALDLLAAAWSWAIAGLGEDWTLVLCGDAPGREEELRQLCKPFGAEAGVRAVQPSAPSEMASLYQNAGAVIGLGEFHPWADPLLYALASGVPLIAEATAFTSARVGPAGFLTPPGDARALGAALSSVIIEQSLSESLRLAARERSAAWHGPGFTEGLARVYGI
jgi:glycosyltransferase involved in cell wall biosynthesis